MINKNIILKPNQKGIKFKENGEYIIPRYLVYYTYFEDDLLNDGYTGEVRSLNLSLALGPAPAWRIFIMEQEKSGNGIAFVDFLLNSNILPQDHQNGRGS